MGVFTIEPLTTENAPVVLPFLFRDESTCVTLASFFVTGKTAHMGEQNGVYRIIFKKELSTCKSVFGFFAITDSGLLLHHMPFVAPLLISSDKEDATLLQELTALVKPVLDAHPLYCIMGEQYGCAFFSRTYPKPYTCNRDYILMRYASPAQPQTSPQAQTPSAQPTQTHAPSPTQILTAPQLPDGFYVRKCTEDDAELLYPLQREYEIVEVLPPGDTHNPISCKASLRRTLQVQQVYALFCGTTPIAKAGTNAQSFHYSQIGGVFTVEPWRKHGFATLLVRHVAEQITAEGKKAVLFVKTNNEPAKHAYQKAGFEAIGGYNILYY